MSPTDNGRLRNVLGTAFLLCVLLVGPGFARSLVPASKAEATRRAHQRLGTATAERPQVQYAFHNRGKMQLAVANNGTFGTFGEQFQDPFTGDRITSCVYPRNTDLVYLFVGAFWIGAIVGKDTLVSCGSEDFYETSEFWPDPPSLGGEFTYNSIDINSKFYDPIRADRARSEQDLTCVYYDTITDLDLVGVDHRDNRPHRPLGIKVTQRSMAWSYDYADDFILFDYEIENVGNDRLKQVYIGIWVDGDIWHFQNRGPGEPGWDDDVVGFRASHPAPEGCGFVDTINIAWHADNDGDPAGTEFNNLSPRSAMGVRVVRTPSDSLDYSFNWWIIDYSDPSLDFGPRQAGTPGDPFRSFGARLGTPEGDRNRYYMLSHPEFDYDQYTTAVRHVDEGFLPPPPRAEQFAEGYDSRYLLSFGPFAIEPGQVLPLSFAWVGGEDFHTDPTAFQTVWNPNAPQDFYHTLDFSELALNSRWASWVYDNPGVDTDSDGYAGKYRICGLDSIPADSLIDTADVDLHWYEGDGVPDFRGAGPPPAPRIRVIPSVNEFVIRWNGYYSETTDDIFLGLPDFEGYRVYAGLDERDNSFSLLASYDRENFNIYRWRQDSSFTGWQLEGTPVTLEALRTRFGDPNLDPLTYTRVRPYRYEGDTYYFEAQDFNISDLTSPDGIRKVYPEITEPPSSNPEDWTEDEVLHDYGEPLPKYYEYEYVFDSALETIPYYLAVTAFDFGSPVVGLPALESQPANNYIIEFAQNDPDSVEANDLDVFVYPNPYRIDAGYRAAGYEGRAPGERDLAPDYVKRIHFTNLPKVCTISIYSLDGDLIRTWEHDFPEGGPGSMHSTWDLITRNRQLVVSGLYYWVVESSTRTQIGKLMIVQ